MKIHTVPEGIVENCRLPEETQLAADYQLVRSFVHQNLIYNANYPFLLFIVKDNKGSYFFCR
jgi:hypothetical protein